MEKNKFIVLCGILLSIILCCEGNNYFGGVARWKTDRYIQNTIHLQLRQLWFQDVTEAFGEEHTFHLKETSRASRFTWGDNSKINLLYL